MEDEWVQRVKNFVTVCVHTILYARDLYPSFIFQQRKYLGMTVWQSRHPEVNSYISKVLNNAEVLMKENLVDRFVLATFSADGSVVDHTTIKCIYDSDSPADDPTTSSSAYLSSSASTQSRMALLEEEFRSIVLRLGMLDQQLPKLAEDATWQLMVVTRIPHGTKEVDLMQQTLVSGDWFVDNNKLSEQIAQSNRAQRRQPRLLSLKSFRGASLNISVYAHIFTTPPILDTATEPTMGYSAMEVQEEVGDESSPPLSQSLSVDSQL